jgi:hypothetical protein
MRPHIGQNLDAQKPQFSAHEKAKFENFSECDSNHNSLRPKVCNMRYFEIFAAEIHMP